MFVFLGLTATATPYLVVYYAEQWLTEQGVPDPEIASLSLNPFTGVVVAEGIDVSAPGKPASVGEVAADIEITELFSGRLLMADLTLSSGEILVSRSERGWSAGGLTFGTGQDGGATEGSQGGGLPVGLNHVTLRDVEIVYEEPERIVDLSIDSLDMGPFATWAPDTPTNIDMEGEVLGAPFTIDGEVLPLAAPVAVQAEVDIKNFDIPKVAAVPSGSADFSGSIDLLVPEGSVELDIDGTAALKEFQITPASREISISAATFEQLAVQLAVNTRAGIFDLGHIDISGSGPVRIVDTTIEPTVDRTIEFDRAQIQQTDGGAAVVTISGAVKEGGQLNISGTIDPQTFNTNLQLDVDGVELPGLSGYLPGYAIERGRLGLESSIGVDTRVLDVTNEVVIDKLLMSSTGEEEGDPVEGIDMPINLALDLLKDGDDRISLEVPVGGTLDDPNFGIGDAVRTAMQGALRKAAIGVAATALQPFGAIVLAANAAGKLTRPRFEPIEFEPDQTVLTGTALEYVEKISELMQKRPNLTITLCGIATPVDNAEDLSLLADARRGAVVERLVEGHGIPAERLYECKSSVETTEEQAPRVSVML